MFLKILTVAGLATFEIYAAIPAGFAFGLSPWMIFFASLTGGLAGAIVAAFFGDRIRAFFHKKKPTAKEETQKHPVITKLWNKYGVVGLGTIGTITVGAPISIAVGTGLNVNLKKLLVWCCIGVLIRCSVFTAIGYYGLQLL
jgi:membrane protein YqaA with SNARE-associated domain